MNESKESVKVDFTEEKIFLIIDGQTFKTMSFYDYFNDYRLPAKEYLAIIKKEKWIDKIDKKLKNKVSAKDYPNKNIKKIGKFKDFLDI